MRRRLPLLRSLIVLLSVLLWPLTAAARDVFVMLSGGASPLSNNYSQYLQAKAVTKFFHDNYPADSVWVFFGAGNLEGEPPVFGDVRKQYKQDGLVLESWVPGPLPRNRPAKREEVLRAFREEILPAVRDGGTLYLFVGDHGSTTRTGDYDTTIDLWGVDPDPASPRGWRMVNHEILTARDLQGVLAGGLGRGRVVFCMTQCYSGGFHFLGIPRHLAPPAAWFAGAIPEWAAPTDEAPLPAAAGYAATDHYSLAAGCDPDPDPDKWAGYERFVPENLLGLDLFTLEPAGERRRSFHEAHIEATLVDRTIDKPHATSERYLERWATAIERLAETPELLQPKVRAAVEDYRRAVDTGRPRLRGAAMRERAKLFARFTERLAEQAPTAADAVLKGSRADLDQLAGALPPGANFARPPAPAPGAANAPTNRRAQGTPEARKLWTEVVQPAWKAAVEAGAIAELQQDTHKLAFEQVLLAEEARGRNLMFANNWQSPLLPHIFWATGAHDPATADPERAAAVARWGAERRQAIITWARAAEDPAVREAAEKAFAAPRRPAARPATGPTAPIAPAQERATVSTRPLPPKIAAERTLLYRRVLAAWAFLETVKHREALAEVKRLTTLERTPLPRGRG